MAFYDYALASLNLNIGSKPKVKARRTGSLISASKKFRSEREMKIGLRLDLRNPENACEKYSISF
jgi:hypothetical protein